MHKYYDDLEDYHDKSSSPLLAAVEWLMPRIIAVGSVVLVLMFCARLEAL